MSLRLLSMMLLEGNQEQSVTIAGLCDLQIEDPGELRKARSVIELILCV